MIWLLYEAGFDFVMDDVDLTVAADCWRAGFYLPPIEDIEDEQKT